MSYTSLNYKRPPKRDPNAPLAPPGEIPSTLETGEKKWFEQAKDSPSNADDMAAEAILKKLGTTRIPLDFTTISQTLVVLRQAKTFYTVTTANIPPGATLSIQSPVASSIVSLEAQTRFVVGLDHVLSMTMTVDDLVVLSDTDVVQARYNSPTKWFSEQAQVFPSKKYTNFSVTNNSSTQTCYFSVADIGITVRQRVYDMLIENYLMELYEEIGGQM